VKTLKKITIVGEYAEKVSGLSAETANNFHRHQRMHRENISVFGENAEK